MCGSVVEQSAAVGDWSLHHRQDGYGPRRPRGPSMLLSTRATCKQAGNNELNNLAENFNEPEQF